MTVQHQQLKLPGVNPAGENEIRDYRRKLRKFYQTGAGGGVNGQLLPALMVPYNGNRQILSGYPFCISAGENSTTSFLPLSELISSSIAVFAPLDNQAQVLKKVKDRFVADVGKAMNEDPVGLRPFLDEMLDKLVTKLAVKGDEGAAFARDVDTLKASLPEEGKLFAFSPPVHLYLLAAALEMQTAQKRNKLRTEMNTLAGRLDEMLAVEREKSGASRKPETLRSSYSVAAEYFDFNALASMLPEGGSEKIPAERMDRIRKTLAALEKGKETLFGNDAHILVFQDMYDDKSLKWKEIFPRAIIKKVKKMEGCRNVAAAFDEQAKAWTEAVAALRIAHLELEGRYDASVHDDLFARFDWRTFSKEEMACCPPVILVDTDEALVTEELSPLSKVLASGRPVKFLVVNRRSRTGFRENGSGISTGIAFQQELGALAVSHRFVFAMQGTPVSPSALLGGLNAGLQSAAPAVLYIMAAGRAAQRAADTFLRISAAVESRTFPGFTYNSGKGAQWGSRFDVTNNPQTQEDWPLYDLPAKDENGGDNTLRLAFTFADFAACDDACKKHFMVVPPGFWTEDLVPLHRFSGMEQEDLRGKVPFIWMADANHTLHKAALTHEMALMSMDRLDFWHYLQENGGTRNYHVQQALERMQQEWEDRIQKERKALQEEHGREVERARKETAAEAMERLTAFLLDMDAGAIVPAPVQTPGQAPAAAEIAPQQEEPVRQQAGEETLTSAEPWLDTAQCTSCNECTDINSRMFVYNTDKQAVLANAKAGTYAELVQAAEKCPAKIIHPGSPLNPDEPDLEELKKRAAPFNQ